MIGGITLSEYIAEEKSKLNEMSRREKISYFKSYYLGYLIAIVLGIILAVAFVHDAIIASKDELSSGIVMDLTLSKDGTRALTDGLKKYAGSKDDAFISNEMYFNSDDPTLETGIQAQLAAGSYDYAIASGKALKKVINYGVITGVSEAGAKELAEKYGCGIISLTDSDGVTIDAAIDISGTEFVRKYVGEGVKVYFIFTGMTKSQKKGLLALEYILDQK